MNARFAYIAFGAMLVALAALAGDRLTGLYLSPSGGSSAGSAEISISTPDYDLHYNATTYPNATALALLETVTNVTYETYASGKMITAINNISQDSGHYWLYFMNGNLSMVSADAQTVDAGDVIEFRYLDSGLAMAYFSQ